VGTYSVTLRATNGGGSSAPYTRTDYIVVTDPIAPHADFMSDNTEGVRPFTINFQDMSAGSGVFTYLWNFGDGTTSTVRNASHTYTSTGTYTVSLTINSVTYPGASDQMVKSNYITIKDPYPPVADFTYSQPRNYWPVTVTFTDSTSGTPPFTYDWDFGDGTTMHAISGQTVVTHTYTHAGTFSVTLTSHNEMGDNSVVKSNAITVYDPVLPTASFYADTTTGPKTLHVTFIASASTGTPPLSYTWDFGEGSPVTTASPTISHDYASVGTYNVRLNVSNEWGYDIQTKNGYIVVNYPAPVANFNPAFATGRVPYTVSFTDTSTNPTSWSWDFGDGTTDTSRNPTHTYTVPGRYTVSLTATNPSGSNTKTVADCVIVSPAAAFTGTPVSGSRPLPVQFTDSSAGNPTAWLWDFGDGVTDTVQNPLHRYTVSGTYTVTLTVTANGVSDSTTKANYITVNSVIPHGVSLPSDDTYMFQIRGPNGTIIGNFTAGQQKIMFGGLASTEDGSIVATAATPGTYEIWAKRTYSQGPMYGYGVEVYDQMKLGQSVDNDSAAKMGSRELINSLWITDRAGLVTFSDEGNLDAPLDYLNGTPRSHLINSINSTNSNGWTDMYGGMYLARQQFESRPNPRPDAQKIEVLLTDGDAINSTLDETAEKALCQLEANRAVADGIKIYTIGIGNTPDEVDGPFLQEIADMTGGTYQFCSSYEEIWEAFKNIGAQLEQNISTTSDLNIVPERTQIAGVWYNNTTLIPGTGKTWTDGNTSNPGSYAQQPNIFLNGNMYNLTWNIDPIKLSHTWTLTYQVKAEKVGYTHPVSNLSYAAIHIYNSTDIIPVSIESDIVYVASNLTDNMTDVDMLSIHISMPYEGYPITQPSQDLLWTVNYHGIARYNVIKEYAPYGTLNWKPIGGVDESNETHTFSDVWNLGSQVPPGRYTLRMRASDGWFNASSILNFTVQYMPGQINVVDSP
jgi:PKD repeat protein